VAMTAINSHVSLAIALECARRQPDLFLVYMGNNEVVGPFGAGTVFGKQAPSLAIVRATVALKRSRLGQWLDAGLQQIGGRDAGPQTFTGMDMFSENRLRSDDARMDRVYSHFHRNLEDIIAAGNRARSPIVLCTVGSNLKDCAPFASLSRPTLNSSEKAEWQKLFDSGATAQKSGDRTGARELFRRALKLDDHHAETHFRLAQCELMLQNTVEAESHFVHARDEDALRFRTDSKLNQLIREAATKHSTQGVRLLDVEKVLARESSNHIAGAEFFYEHVHFNFAGNYLVARAFAEKAEESAPLLKRGRIGRWLTEAECAERLAFTHWNRLETAELLRKRITRPPFTYQFDHEAKVAEADREIQQLKARLDSVALRQILDVNQRAVDAAPQDWVLRANFARLLRRVNDVTGAVQQCVQVVTLLPHRADWWCQWGLYLQEANRADDAARAFEQALKLDGREARAYYGLGLIKIQTAQFADAIGLLSRSLEIDADFADARGALGEALAGSGKTNEAILEFERVLNLDPSNGRALAGLKELKFGGQGLQERIAHLVKRVAENPQDAELQFVLGQALVADGQFAQAKKHFAAAVALDSGHADAHYFLAQEMARENLIEDAIVHYSKVAELRPADAQAHFNLGVMLARMRRFREALEQFETTLRLNPGDTLARQYAATVRAQLQR